MFYRKDSEQTTYMKKKKASSASTATAVQANPFNSAIQALVDQLISWADHSVDTLLDEYRIKRSPCHSEEEFSSEGITVRVIVAVGFVVKRVIELPGKLMDLIRQLLSEKDKGTAWEFTPLPI